MKVGLVGNPNVGKSTIFNILTGMHQHTGNWPGKTVVKASGYKKYQGVTYLIEDLPGTYSLMAHSKEEEVTRDFIYSMDYDALIIVCDAVCLERNLNLVLQILEITNKGFDASNKETGILECLKLALEMTARGIKFKNIDLNKSQATTFCLDDDNNLIPPFTTIDGLGDTVAKTIVEERNKGEFLSIEDLQKRGKVSSTLIEKMRNMHILDNLDESSQLSLF